MKITTVREIVQNNGNKTVITVEEDMNGADENQLGRHLETIGFYDSQPITSKIMRFVRGKRNV